MGKQALWFFSFEMERDMAESNEKLLIGIRELSELTGIAGGTLYHWAAAGRVPCVRFSARCLRFRRAEVEAWLSSLSTPVEEQPTESVHVNGRSGKKRYDK
jgi:excisionase family DNA binding protein